MLFAWIFSVIVHFTRMLVYHRKMQPEIALDISAISVSILMCVFGDGSKEMAISALMYAFSIFARPESRLIALILTTGRLVKAVSFISLFSDLIAILFVKHETGSILDIII